MFWVISVYFNIRNTLPKSGTFLLGHPVYIFIYYMTQCSVVMSNVICYKRDYEVILFKSLPLLKLRGTVRQLNPRNRTDIQALMFKPILRKYLLSLNHNNLPLLPILSQMIPLNDLQFYIKLTSILPTYLPVISN